MAKKNNEQSVDVTEAIETETTEDLGVEAKNNETANGEDKPKKADKSKTKKDDKTSVDQVGEPSVFESLVDSAVSAVESVVESVVEGTTALVDAVVGQNDSPEKSSEGKSKRAERVGIVSSDKMTKTVTVRVDRQVKHPIYRKYIKRRKKFMAHDELGATTGDKVRIIETRPLSARKRWRVVEIIQKAEK